MSMATKGPQKSKPKTTVGKLDLTPKQRQIIAEGVETDFFKVLRDIVVPKREIEVALTSLATGLTQDDLWYHKGMSAGMTRLLAALKQVADEYNKTNGDADTDGVDPVD